MSGRWDDEERRTENGTRREGEQKAMRRKKEEATCPPDATPCCTLYVPPAGAIDAVATATDHDCLASSVSALLGDCTATLPPSITDSNSKFAEPLSRRGDACNMQQLRTTVVDLLPRPHSLYSACSAHRLGACRAKLKCSAVCKVMSDDECFGT